MFQTNTKQCQDARSGELSYVGSCGTHSGDCNSNCGNSSFANSLLVKKITKNCIFHLSITKSGPQLIQLNKFLEEISTIYQDKHHDYIPDIISSNTKLTQAYFLSNHPIKRWHSSKHHIKLGLVDPIIGLDVSSGNSPIDPEMVENTPIFNLNPQE